MSAVPADSIENSASFRDLGLSDAVLLALADVGYESPSPIQAQTIPVLLSGKDMLGQAQTGTGKTAAFALPALTKIDLARHEPQVLVLVPTRELALQVSEAFLRYAAHLKGFHVLPIYGGQSYQPQLNALRRGVHVVVGTPGRVIDHMNRGTLKLSGLTLLVLDEADEMLRMGFIDAVESILEQTPPQRQVALFSATIPAPIRRIAAKHLRTPVEVTIKSKTSTATNIRQRYWMVSGMHKLDALTRILEAETFDGMLVFTRTKQATVELAEKLEARGFAAAPLNGDIAQPLRERTVARLKAGQIDILVATDVAARGLDVERISHVVNYDVPYDTESYVHRIGRTGRAGRTGEAILFIAPRERNMLRAIERATRQVIEPMNLPSVDAVNTLRIAKFKQRITETIAKGDSNLYRPVLEQLETESGMALIDIAAALASLSQGSTPLLLAQKPERPADAHPATRERDSRREEPLSAPRERPAAQERDSRREERPRKSGPAQMETFRIEVGSVHGIKPGNIVGAIANEADIEGVHIGRVDIREDHSYVDLPEGMPKEIFKQLQKVRVAGRELRISRIAEKPPKPPRATLGRHPGAVPREARPAKPKIAARRRAKD
jgi:ATP-dependent RNA helicase DeaD